MTDVNEDMVLDGDGIPILTDLVQADETAESTEQRLPPLDDELSAEELAGQMLNSDAFRQQLDDIAAQLTHSICQQIEQTLRPTIEEAITLAFDDSSTASIEAVRKQLETALPELLVRSRQ